MNMLSDLQTLICGNGDGGSGPLLSAAPTDSQKANGCFQLDREKSGRVQVDVFLLGGQYIRAQALPSESLVMEKSFRVDSWWE